MGPFERSYHFLTRRAFVLPVILLVAIGLGIAGALQVQFNEDVFALLPQDDARVAEAGLALERFRGLERVVIALESDNPTALAAAVDNADASLREVPGVRAVFSRVDADARQDIAAMYAGKAPRLFDAAMRDVIEQRLNTEFFQQRLQRHIDAQVTLSPVDTFRSDPFGFDELVAARFEHLAGGFRGARDDQGRVLSQDGRFAVLFVEADFSSSDTGRGREFMRQLEDALAGDVVFHVIGAHRSSVDNAIVLRSDMHLTIATSVVCILLLFFAAFRSLTPMMLPLLSVGFGFVVALGAQGWISGSLSAITAGFSAVLLGISVDYGIHLAATYAREQGDRPERARLALAHIGRPAFVAALTTIAAILMLRFSSFDGLHQLAEMAVAGIAGALVFALLAGPQLLRVAGPRSGASPGLNRLVSWMAAARRRARVPLMVAAMLVTLGLALCLPLVGFDGDVMNLDGKSAATSASEEVVQRAFGQETLSRTLIVASGNTLQEALRENDLNAAALHSLGASWEGVSWVLPAAETQEENVRRWQALFTEARIEQLKGQMAAATATHPATRRPLSFDVATLEARFERFFATLRLADGPPEQINPDALRASGVWTLLSTYVSGEGDRWIAGSTAVLPSDRVELLRALAPSAIVLNKASFVDRMVRYIQGDLIRVGGLSLLLVLVVLALTFGSLRCVLIALVPVAGAMVWTLGLMGLLGIPFNIINTLVTVFIAGLGIDYGIFFVQTWRGSRDTDDANRRLQHAGSGVLIAALTTLFGFGSLALAAHPALFSVGVTTGIGVLSALVLTLFVVPTLLEWSGRP